MEPGAFFQALWGRTRRHWIHNWYGPPPRSAHAMAMAAPVLPDVAATTVIPGLRFPLLMDCEMMCCAMRSLMDPDGFRYSHLARM